MDKLPKKYFGVTDRNLVNTESQFRYGFTGELALWAEGSSVLILGSGVLGKFEKDIKEKRGDLKVVSIDPSLFLPTDMEITDISHDGTVLLYETKGEYKGRSPTLSREDAIAMQKYRAKNHGSDLPIAAYADYLPFANGVIDVAIDVLGPFHFLREKPMEFRLYLTELFRVISPNGLAYFADCGYEELEIIKGIDGVSIVNFDDIRENGERYFVLKVRKDNVVS